MRHTRALPGLSISNVAQAGMGYSLPMPIEVRRTEPGGDTRDFIRAGCEVFRGDPAWVRPLDFVLKEKLDPKKDPFHRHAGVALFTAYKDGKLVGRTSATIDKAWLDTWKDDTGHFGFFDTIDDADVARALLDAAESWLRERGMKRVNGPKAPSSTSGRERRGRPSRRCPRCACAR